MMHLRVLLGSCTVTWLKSFFEQDGLGLLLRNLVEAERKSRFRKTTDAPQLAVEIVRCLVAIMNSKVRNNRKGKVILLANAMLPFTDRLASYLRL